MSLFAELQRRNVIRVGVAYLVASWLLIEASSLILGIYEAPPMISKVIVALLAIGLPVTLFFAWAFEITPDGVKREAEVDRSASITNVTARKLDMITIVMVVLAAGLLIADRLLAPQTFAPTVTSGVVEGDERASVAVLPFVNMSGSEENEYFSDGLTETLLHMLAQVDQLRVPARTSSFAFKGTNTDVRDIAAQLNVSTILEGSVQRAGHRIRVTAQLVDARDGSHIWSQNYDRDLDDIFGIQDEIANAVASALMASLLGEDVAVTETATASLDIVSVGTRSAEAYDHYLHGLSALATDSHAELGDAVQSFKEALLIDPAFLEAQLALIQTHLYMANTGLVTQAEAAAQARTVMDSVLEAHPDDPLVAGHAAYLEFREAGVRGLRDEAETREIFQRVAASIARAPNHADLYKMIADVLRFIDGSGQERLDFVDRGLAVDPLSTDLMLARANVLLFGLDRPDEALAAYARLRELQPENPSPYGMASIVHLQRHEVAEGARLMAEASQVDRQDHEIPAFIGTYIQNMNLFDSAERWIARAELLRADGGATQMARLRQLYLTGDRDGALDLAEAILRARVDDRWSRYRVAAMIFAWELHARGEDGRVFELFEELTPGSTSDPAFEPQDDLQLALYDFGATLRMIGSDEATRAHWRVAVVQVWDRVTPGWQDDDQAARWRYLWGFEDLDEAAEAQARSFLEPFQYSQQQLIFFSLRELAPLMNHPEVVAVVEDLERRYAAQAELYLEMVANGEVPGS